MAFSVVEEIRILVQQWKVTSLNGLSGSLIAVFSLAVLFEFMNSYHSYLGLPASKRYIAQDSTKTKRIQDHIMRTVSYVLSAIAGFLLMMVVGTGDVWLFISVVFGAAFGFFLSNPLYTWYSSIEVRNPERDGRRINNNKPHGPSRSFSEF